MRQLFVILASVAGLAVCNARVITVDDDGLADFDNIQAAIDDANDGDTVLVAGGTYQCPWPDGITFRGKAITLRSRNGPQHCIVDGRGAGRCFIFSSGEDANSVLEGLTIENGMALYGGGIRCEESSPTIRGCIIRANRAVWSVYCDPMSGICIYTGAEGGGVYCGDSSPLIVDCIISNNTADSDGGGVRCYTGGEPGLWPNFRNCLVVGNNAAEYGDGIYRCKGEISSCTIINNIGDGLRHCGSRITNCIIWNNGDDLYNSFATYCCVQDNDPGEGNIHTDPCFVDVTNGDCHLKSQAGRWDPNQGRWTIDDVTSPCIDAGDRMTPIGAEPFPNGGRINMGAYGGTIEASKSYFGKPPCDTVIAGDVNGDCIVDYRDLAISLMHWLEQG